MRTLIATLIALMLFATTPVVAGGIEEGAAAFQAGDYQKAIRLWKPLAEQGDVRAQAMLGLMYHGGKGVPKDHAKAVHWYTKAAKQGDVGAQFSLSGKHFQGIGVPENYVRGYAWVSIAAAQGHASGNKAKELFTKFMTPAQIAEAQKLSRELWDKYVVPFQKE